MPWLILTLKLFETLFFQTNSNCRTCFWHFLFSCRGSIHLCATFPWTAIFVEHTTHIPTSSYHFMAIGSNIISTTSFGINNSYEQFGSWAFRFVDRGDSCTCARSVHGTWDNMSKELHGIWHRYGIVMASLWQLFLDSIGPCGRRRNSCPKFIATTLLSNVRHSCDTLHVWHMDFQGPWCLPSAENLNRVRTLF